LYLVRCLFIYLFIYLTTLWVTAHHPATNCRIFSK